MQEGPPAKEAPFGVCILLPPSLSAKDSKIIQKDVYKRQMAEDEQFKAELLRQRNVYRQLNQEAHAAIDARGGSAQGQSAMAKLNTCLLYTSRAGC